MVPELGDLGTYIEPLKNLVITESWTQCHYRIGPLNNTDFDGVNYYQKPFSKLKSALFH